MLEEEEPLPILKPLRIVEFILCLACLAFFMAYISLAHNDVGLHLIGFLYATFITFFVVCLVDIISQVSGEPAPSTPMFLFCLFAVGMFLASGVIGINFYDHHKDYSWCLLGSAVASLIATIFFTMDAAMLCRYKRPHHFHGRRPLLQWPKWEMHSHPKEAPMEPQQEQPISDVPQQWQDEERKQYTHIRVDKPRRTHRTQRGLPKLGFYAGKNKDEMVQTSASHEQQLEVPAEPPVSMYTPVQQPRDDNVLVDDKRVLYRQVSQGHVLQIVNSINVRRLTGTQSDAEKGSDSNTPDTKPMIEAAPTSDSAEISETGCKDVTTQFPERQSNEDMRKKPICCCRGDFIINPSPASTKDHSVQHKAVKPTHSSAKRGKAPANRSRDQEIQVDPYQLGMRVVPVQRRPDEVTTAPSRKHLLTPAAITPVSVTSRCDVDMFDLLPGSVPETYKK